jgi:uroporphyrinogen III methyltransferase/synthase
VYLVGAGCGEADLITLRGMKLLRDCDAVVYDSLIDGQLLAFVPETAEKICVGKRAGHHSETQERINRIIVQKAQEGKIVVRLKGGDPLVFGRGGEEVLALQENGIPYSIVPGVTSAVAVPELAGIPVTHRRVSRSFHVITGHTADAVLPEKMEQYAGLEGTLVFLMGLKNLPQIADGLMTGGMSSAVPAAVISCGGTPQQRIVRGRLDNIAALAEQEVLTAPAVIVVGKTAEMNFASTLVQPLDGVSVTVTGTRRFAEKLAAQLSVQGAYVQRMGLLRVTEYEDNPELDSALQHIGDYDWLVLTSVNGAEIFLRRLRRMQMDIRQLSRLKIAVIGSGTAGYLEKYGIFPELVPEAYTSAALGSALLRTAVAGERVLLLRAEKGSAELTEILERGGFPFEDIRTYDVIPEPETRCCQKISTDFLTFASASGVDAFFAQGYTISPYTGIVCIGEVTAAALKRHGIRHYLAAHTQNAGGISDVILKAAPHKDCCAG